MITGHAEGCGTFTEPQRLHTVPPIVTADNEQQLQGNHCSSARQLPYE